MNDTQFLFNTYFRSFIKILRVNMNTGEYTVIKQPSSIEEASCLCAKDIISYLERLISKGILSPVNNVAFSRFMNICRESPKLLSKKLHFSHYAIYKNGYEKIWTVVELTAPDDFGEKNPWVLLSIKQLDNDRRLLEDSMKMLNMVFYKIVRVNLRTNRFEAIRNTMSEENMEYGASRNFLQEYTDVGKNGDVHPDDLQKYLDFMDTEMIIRHFTHSSERLGLKYRRRSDDEFRWVFIELMPCIDFSEDNPNVIFYVRDIHEQYAAQLEKQMRLETFYQRDMATGLKSRYSYNDLCDAYRQLPDRPPLSVLFADINGLKYTNDHFGHTEGDLHIKNFSDRLLNAFGPESCYRISGDEFVVVDMSYSENDFIKKCTDFYDEINSDSIPLAALGYIYQSKPDTIEGCVKSAETAMYFDKRLFYETHPDYERRS